MLAKLAMNANNNNKKNSAAITSDVDDDYLFCKAVRMAYDHSEFVHRYFRNNPSRINPQNKGLWPLGYQGYKEHGV